MSIRIFQSRICSLHEQYEASDDSVIVVYVYQSVYLLCRLLALPVINSEIEQDTSPQLGLSIT